jgi:peptide deformylase
MAVLDIVVWPAEVLETKSEPVTKFDDQLRNFIADMHETMQAANGIGLAANQVGRAIRAITIEIPFSESRYSDQEEKLEWWHNKKFTFINPKIVKSEGKITFQEGCLSFPEIYEYIGRASEVWVEAYNERGEKFEVHATGLLAVCLQHEIDHIDGIVFMTRMSRLKQGIVKKRMLRRGTMASVEQVDS